jgi:NADH-quinone oxidoreductase subunit N
MSAAEFTALAPLAALGIGALAALVLAPVAGRHVTTGMVAAAMALALAILLLRAGAPHGDGALFVDDGLARFGAALAILSGLGALAAGGGGAAVRETPVLLALAVSGAVTLAAAGHGATLFLGLEIMTLALIGLTVAPRTSEAIEAAYKLFLMAGAGAAALLLGMAFLMAEAGTPGLAAWSGEGAVASLGRMLVLAGLAVKFGLVPFHMWMPDLIAGAPKPASSFVAAASKVAVGVALLRLGQEVPAGALWRDALAVTGSASVLLGSLAALTQTGFMRMLGYSAVAHSGFMAMILAAGGPRTGEALLVYLAGYAPAAIVAFCVAATWRAGEDDMTGILWRRPVAGAGLIVALLSMSGLPPMLGFLGKAYLFAVLAEAQAYVLLAVAALGAALGFAFYMRFALRAASTGSEGAPASASVGWFPGLVVVAGGAALVLNGVFPEPLLSLARAVLP